ncbi:MAG: zinc ribbon domain-containing protein [Planctomycetia bacterium]|nr:zinc ribbon domain-containing protein [Planctomycetia bacterium]
MAVKVKCPTCEKVLNAPDSARGKAVKCPGCETKVKVPAGDAEGGGAATTRKTGTKIAAKKKEEDSSDFLARLDIDAAADSSQAMCPKCGALIPEDASECPKCGVDPETGQISKKTQKRMSRKGADPALFYRLAWSDSWAFTMENKRVAWRTALYLIIADLAVGVCNAAINYCDTWPPQVFWAFLAATIYLAVWGWPWHLNIETIKATVARKSNIHSIHFDVFLCMALGIKWFVWNVVFCCWLVVPIVMYPLAMIHMAMPVTKRGWIFVQMFSTFAKNAGAAMYYWMIWFALHAIVVGVWLLGYLSLTLAYGGPKIIQYYRDRLAQQPISGQTDWIIASVVIFLGVVSCVVTGFVRVFMARVLGLLALYFKDTLDLVVFVEEKVYKRKEVKVDKWGTPIKTPQQIAGQIAIGIVVLIVVAGAGFAIYWTQFRKS